MHHFIMIQMEKSYEERIKVNLTQEEIDKQYNGDIQIDMVGDQYHLLAKMLRVVAGIDRIVIPGDFKSAQNGSQAIACSIKVSDGYLYPLQRSLIFIQKPITYIKHKEIKYVEFNRIGNQSGGIGKSFDITVAKVDQEGQASETFKNIDKKELKVMIQYF